MFNLNPLLSLLWAFCSHLFSTDPLSTLIFPLLPLPIHPTRFFQSCSFLPCASPPPLALCLPRRHLALVYSSEPEEGGAREARSGGKPFDCSSSEGQSLRLCLDKWSEAVPSGGKPLLWRAAGCAPAFCWNNPTGLETGLGCIPWKHAWYLIVMFQNFGMYSQKHSHALNLKVKCV